MFKVLFLAFLADLACAVVTNAPTMSPTRMPSASPTIGFAGSMPSAIDIAALVLATTATFFLLIYFFFNGPCLCCGTGWGNGWSTLYVALFTAAWIASFVMVTYEGSVYGPALFATMLDKSAPNYGLALTTQQVYYSAMAFMIFSFFLVVGAIWNVFYKYNYDEGMGLFNDNQRIKHVLGLGGIQQVAGMNDKFA